MPGGGGVSSMEISLVASGKSSDKSEGIGGAEDDNEACEYPDDAPPGSGSVGVAGRGGWGDKDSMGA